MTDTRYSPTPDEFFKAAVHAAGLLSFRNAFGLTDSAEVTAIKSEFSREDFEEAGCERNLDAWIRDYAGIAGPLTAGQRREGFIELLIHETPKAESLDVLLGGVMKGLYDEFSQCRQTHPFWLNPAQARRWHALSLARRLPMLLVYAHGLLAKIHEANAEVFSKLTPPMIWRTLTAKEPVDAAFEGRRIQNLWFDAVVQPQVVEKTKSGVAAAAKLDVASFRKMISGASEPEWHTLGKCVDGVANGNPDAKAALIHAYLFARILDSVWASLGELFGENDAERLREILSGAGIRVDETCGYVDEERHRFFAGGISECATTMLSFLLQTETEVDPVFLSARAGRETLPLNSMDHYAHHLGRLIFCKHPEQAPCLMERLGKLAQRTVPNRPMCEEEILAARTELDALRHEFPGLCQTQEHALLILEARLVVHSPGADAEAWLQDVARLSWRAVEALREGRSCQDPAGMVDEALKVMSWMYRNDIKTLGTSTEAKSLGPLLLRLLDLRDAIAGADAPKDFDHKDPERRFELYARQWECELHPAILRRLPRTPANPEAVNVSLTEHLHMVTEDLEPSPAVRKDRKAPILNPGIGRENAPLMEEILPSPNSTQSRGDTAPMLRVMNLEADPRLNYINTTGDTAMTYAFAGRRYDLAMAILRRVPHAITTDTLLHKTRKGRCAIWYAISHGRRELLEEMLRPSDSSTGRALISLSEIRLTTDALTPLEFANRQHSLAKLSYQEYGKLVTVPGAISLEVRRIREAAAQNPRYLEWLGRSAEEEGDKPLNPDGIQDCITYLTNLV